MKKQTAIRTLEFQGGIILGGQVSGTEEPNSGDKLAQQPNTLKAEAPETDMGFHISADPIG
jgi:hypothetical protein